MRVLIVGLGSIGKKHVKALQQVNADVEIFAFRSSRYAISSDCVVSNFFELDKLDEYSFDFAIISNPTFQHKATIESLLSFKIPLFIEKPLFDSLGHDKLLHFIKELRISTYVACNLRFLECLIEAKAIIKGKMINEVNVYCGSYLPNWRPEQDFRKVYSASTAQGGGVHMDLIHEIDYIYWIFGKPVGVKRNISSMSSLHISAIDYANYLLKYKGFYASIILNYYRKDSKRYFEVICEDGTLYINLLENKIYWNNKSIFEGDGTIATTYTTQMAFFINKILQNKVVFNSIDEAYDVLKICLTED